MGIRVTYNPVGAIGAGALQAGYGQYQKWAAEKAARELAERNREALEAQRINNESARFETTRQDRQRESEITRELDRQKRGLDFEERKELARMGTEAQRETDRLKSEQAFEAFKKKDEYEYTTKQQREIDKYNNDWADLHSGKLGLQPGTPEFEDAERQIRAGRAGIKPFKPVEKPKPPEIISHESGGFFFNDGKGWQYKGPEKAEKEARDQISAKDLGDLRKQAYEVLKRPILGKDELGNQYKTGGYEYPTPAQVDAYIQNVLDQHRKVTGRELMGPPAPPPESPSLSWLTKPFTDAAQAMLPRAPQEPAVLPPQAPADFDSQPPPVIPTEVAKQIDPEVLQQARESAPTIASKQDYDQLQAGSFYRDELGRLLIKR